MNWIMRFPSVFHIVGTPGRESVVLMIGKNREAAEAAAAEMKPVAVAVETPLPVESRAETAVAACAATESENATGGGFMDEAGQADGANFDEDTLGDYAVQLRGLPYKATVEDIRNFLGEHCDRLASDAAIYLVLNRDGRPSGFARVLFTSPEAARACRDDRHLRSMDDRYVEVFLFSDRPSKGRKLLRSEESTPPQVDINFRPGALPLGTPHDKLLVTHDHVLHECRNAMSDPTDRRILLSMLGVALTPGARAYLKHADLGLKNFLVQYPNEFEVDGQKGSEHVTFTPRSEAQDGYAGSHMQQGFQRAPVQRGSLSTLGPSEAIPASPKPARTPNADIHSASRGLATPSNWGTPNAWDQFMPPFPHGACGLGAGGDAAAAMAGAWGPAPTWNIGSMPMPIPSMPMPGLPMPYWPTGGGGSNFDAAAIWQIELAAAAAAAQGRGGGAGQFKGHAEASSASGTNAAAKPFTPSGQTPDNTMPSVLTSGIDCGSTCLRLRGLPFVSTEQDILAFFAQHDIVDRVIEGSKAVTMILRSNGRPSGQAVVQMRDRESAELAQKVLSGQWMGTRYIEVFLQNDDSTEAPSPAGVRGDTGTGASGLKQNGPMTLSLACTLPSGPMMGSGDGDAGDGSQYPPQGHPSWQAGLSWMPPSGLPGVQMGQHYMGVDGSGGGRWEDLFSFLHNGQAGGDVLAGANSARA